MGEELLLRVNVIIIYGLFTFVLSTALYPLYIRMLRRFKAGKTIRESDVTGSQALIF